MSGNGAHRVRVAVDVGGTFTDLVAYDEEADALRSAKVLTTPDDLSRGVVEAIAACGVTASEVGDFIHGTTAGTNAVIEGKTADATLITSKGFRDVIELMRGDRPLPVYDMSWHKPDPLIPRNRRFEVDERVDARGHVIHPLDEAQLRCLLRSPAFDDAKSVAVCFLHSFLFHGHEQRAAEIIAEERPDLFVSLSCDINPEVREYERTSTVALDALLKPLMASYLRKLEHRLRGLGLSSDVYVMLANAGIMPLSDTVSRPILTLHSGPAGGVVGALLVGEALNRRNIITADMGGTSFDVCTIPNGKLRFRTEGFVRWGIPFRIPLIDVGSIGAGGGSIGWNDAGGLLRVGPRSAGAVPGPACYGLGGSEPTVTDACAVLGYFGHAELAGGAIQLRPELSHRTVQDLANRIGKSPEYVANGIIQIAIANMAGEIRKNSVERGDDPREFSLVSFGGAGSMFASVLARNLGMREVLVPPHAGVFSAYGMLGADLRFDVQRTFYGRLEDLDLGVVGHTYADMERDARAQFPTMQDQVSISREAALRYVGQRHELRVPLSSGKIGTQELTEARLAFDRLHGLNYGHERRGDPVEVRGIAVTATVPRPKPSLNNPGEKRSGNALKEYRQIHLTGEHSVMEVPVYERLCLVTGSVLRGPAVLESQDATVVIHTGETATVDRTGSIVIQWEQ